MNESQLIERAADLLAGVLDQADRVGVKLDAELVRQIAELLPELETHGISDDERSNGRR